jgi:hypothetical protein
MGWRQPGPADEYLVGSSAGAGAAHVPERFGELLFVE